MSDARRDCRYAQVGACNCDTKTPELKHHKPTCRYRVLGEAAERIEQLERERDEARREAEYLLGEDEVTKFPWQK